MRHKTSIIILSYNTLEMLQLCIRSIREHTEAQTYEIIVVDNASKDGSAAWLKEQEDLRCIYNEENQGFPKGCNQGLSIAEGTELLLLNSDVIVTKNWLENLRRALCSSPRVGAVSCVTNYCSNNQQIEVTYKSIEEMQAFAADYNRTDPTLWEKRTTLVGFCYLFKREVFERVGFLDERFSPGNFEDDDYSLRILQLGYDLLVCRDTFIHHFGHASFLKGNSQQEVEERRRRTAALLERNRALFMEKWHVPEMYKAMDAESLRRHLPSLDERGEEGGASLPEGKKIAVLVRRSHAARYETCMAALQDMKWPAGYAVEAFALDAAKPYAAEVNKVLAAADAEIKIYINDDLCLVRPQAIEELLTLFEDKSIGMIGFLGSASLPVSGNLMDSSYKCGAVYVPSDEDFSEMRFGEARGGVADVRCLLPSFFATQQDVVWDESYEKQYYAVLAHCRAMEDAGMRVVVPLTQDIWCAYQGKDIALDASEDDRKKFFGKYHAYVDGTEPQGSDTLYACGEGSEVPSWKKFSHPEGIAVGEGAHIHETALLRLADSNFAGKPRLLVGDRCEIGAFSTLAARQRVELENCVSVAENVHIKDGVVDDSGLGLSPEDREFIANESGVHIERGVRLEENVVVKGAVRIGRGSLVRAGSVVQQDMPAYCIAEGNPAHVTAAFSPRAGKWLPAAGAKALKKLLAEREKTPPLLTVAFITYNRSKYLRRSLPCVLRQLGNDPLAEILVSDNDSTDDTRPFVEGLQKTYRNLRYHCNEKNIGTEANLHQAILESKGEYVLVAGDDDYFVDGSLLMVLSSIVRYRESALFYLGQGDGPLRIYKDAGCLAYIALVSYQMTWDTSIVMRRELYARIPEPHKYDATRLPQVYLQLEMLKQKPEFTILHGNFFMEGTGNCQPDGYDFAEIFIKNYFDILQDVVDLPPDRLSHDKKWVMEQLIIPRCRKIREEHINLSLEGLLPLLQEYYGKEPYYAQLVELFEGMLQK